VRPKRRDDERPAELDPHGYLTELTELGMGAGLDRVGVAPADVLVDTRRHLVERKAAGLHDTMQFTYRNPERSTDPARAVAGARAVIVGARSYLDPDTDVAVEPEGDPVGGPVGRVARYAIDDHYGPLRVALNAVAGRLRSDGYRAIAFVDDNAMVDRAIAHAGGLGWFGKNANLLLPGAGSWFVLGSVVTDAPLPTATTPVADGCGTCERCLHACPTGAIVAPGVIDARRCLSWLLQKSGDFPVEFREALGDRIYGCDDCQEACPPTVHLGHRVPRRDASHATSPSDTHRTVPLVHRTVSLVHLLTASDDELLHDFGRWYVADRDPRWWRRNALVVLGNVADPGDVAVREVLHRYRSGIDDVLASHADWALAQIDRRGGVS
jgi:epoxyqueuosine reductase